MTSHRSEPGTLFPCASGVIAGLLAGVISGAASAAEWYLVPGAEVRTVYHDNFTLASIGGRSVWGTLLELQSEVGVRTEVSGLALTPRLEINRYPGDGEFDSNDPSVALTAYRTLERGELRLDGAYTRDTTLRRGLDETGSELESTGVVQRRVRRERIHISPSWSHALTERADLRVGVAHTDLSYQDVGASGLVDYTYTLVDVALDYRLSERDALSGSVFFSRFDVPDLSGETDDIGVLAGYGRAITEWLRASAAVGVRHSELEFLDAGVSRTDTDVGLLFDLNVAATYELTELEANINRSVSPTGGGSSVERTTVTVSAKRKIAPRLNAVVRVRALTEELVGGAGQNRDRDLIRLRAQLAYRLTPTLRVVPSYTYTRQDRKGRGIADDHALWLALEYRGRKRWLSR